MQQIVDCFFDELTQKIVQLLRGTTLQVVVVRIRREAAEQKRGREPLNCVLLAFDCAGHDFRVQMFVQAICQLRLKGHRLLHKLYKEVAPRSIGHQQELGCNALANDGTSRSLHLQNFLDRVVCLTLLSQVVLLSVHDHNNGGLESL